MERKQTIVDDSESYGYIVSVDLPLSESNLFCVYEKLWIVVTR